MESLSILNVIAIVVNANLGKEVTRKEFILKAMATGQSFSPRYIDKTRRQLTVCGYLRDTGKPGHYIAIQKIPATLTVSRLYKDYCETLGSGYTDPEFICNSETMTNSLKEIRRLQMEYDRQ